MNSGRRRARAQSLPRRSRGAALLLFVLFMMAIGAGVLIDAVLNNSPAPVSEDDPTSRSLAAAKEALLAWAVSHPAVPGQLPFPDRGSDIDGFDGQSDCFNSGSTVAVANTLMLGQFPWRGDDAPGSGCLGAIPNWPMTMELRDSSGQKLWYAVSNKLVFNGNALRVDGTAPAINPGMLDGPTGGEWITLRDSSGAIIRDSSGAPLAVAAVIIAPGKAIGNQDRGVAVNDPAYPAQFLDSVTIGANTYSNADTDPAGNDFIIYPHSSTTAPTTDAFNDRLVYITAAELLRAVEQRVLGEVAVALRAYRCANDGGADPLACDADGAYPWLSPFLDPLGGSTALFDGVPGTRTGHLAYTDPVTETAPGTESYRLDTGFGVTWAAGGLTPAAVASDPDVLSGLLAGQPLVVGPVGVTAMQAQTAAAAAAGAKTMAMPTAPSAGNPSCDWRGTNLIVDCFATRTENPGYSVELSLQFGAIWLPIGTFPVDERTYTFDLAYTGASAAIGSNSRARVRTVPSGVAHTSYPNAGAASTITVKDSIHVVPGLTLSVTRRLTINDGDPATVTVANIYLEPTSGGGLAGDFPVWFHANEWQRYVLVKYANNTLPGQTWSSPGVSACTLALNNCLQVDVRDAAGARNATAIVMGTGFALPDAVTPQDRLSAPAAISDYLEDSNAVAANPAGQRGPWCATAPCVRNAVTWSATPFNDQLRVVEVIP